MSTNGSHIRTKTGYGPILILAVVLVLLFSRDALRQISISERRKVFRQEQLDRELTTHVSMISSNAVDMAVPGVRIVGARKGEGNQLLYTCEYRSATDAGFGPSRLTTLFDAMYLNDPQMAWFRDNKIGIVLEFKDTNGIGLFEISLPLRPAAASGSPDNVR